MVSENDEVMAECQISDKTPTTRREGCGTPGHWIVGAGHEQREIIELWSGRVSSLPEFELMRERGSKSENSSNIVNTYEQGMSVWTQLCGTIFL